VYFHLIIVRSLLVFVVVCLLHYWRFLLPIDSVHITSHLFLRNIQYLRMGSLSHLQILSSSN
jgi:hypothetical protein